MSTNFHKIGLEVIIDIYSLSECYLEWADRFNGCRAVIVKDINEDDNPGMDGLKWVVYFLNTSDQIAYKEASYFYLKTSWLTPTDKLNYKIVEKFKKQELDEELARKYRNGACKECNGPLELDNELWCPICSKPRVEKISYLNFSKICIYIERNGREGASDRLHDYLYGIYGRDCISYVHLPNLEELLSEELEDDPNEIFLDFQAIRKAWDIKEDSTYFQFY